MYLTQCSSIDHGSDLDGVLDIVLQPGENRLFLYHTTQLCRSLVDHLSEEVNDIRNISQNLKNAPAPGFLFLLKAATSTSTFKNPLLVTVFLNKY